MSVRKYRLEKGWSQEQLAHMSGLSVRTVQRIEQGQKAGLESLKCLAAVFELNISDLIKEEPMIENNTKNLRLKDREEEDAIEYVKKLKRFHLNWMMYLVIIPGLYVFNIFVTPEYMWVIWPAMGWGFGIVVKAITIFSLFGTFNAEWEQRQFEKRMRRR